MYKQKSALINNYYYKPCESHQSNICCNR